MTPPIVEKLQQIARDLGPFEVQEAADTIEELVEVIHLARCIIEEDASACRAFRDESEGLSGPENVLAQMDAILARVGLVVEIGGEA